ncbi:hypothetical protein [Pseudoxanthomonas sp. PXM02]|uniref:hypothetical protein n=1 Tax=Pseudoxanthomonas sp. PXM02 TaxID=2769294 RepID=UPI00177E1EFE|nr:hypothetical protein [Pseudoxanthomonas sp. PXM02]MBD9478383.1 hypothetical protein [Pseudoxanthomonas sp. PXM02]
MGRALSVIASIIAIALPLGVAYALRPTPEQNNHAMMWLLLTATSLVVSSLLSGFAIYYGQARFRALPAPRPLHRKIELGVLMLPPILFTAVVVFRVLSSGT